MGLREDIKLILDKNFKTIKTTIEKWKINRKYKLRLKSN